MTVKKRYLIGIAITVGVLAVAFAAWRCSDHDGESQPGPEASDVEASLPASDDSTVSFVILPPEGLGGNEAESGDLMLFCDLLAERLSTMPGVAIVDRSRLDDILAERATAGPGQSPVLSYDAMVRVQLSEKADGPVLNVQVVDLSLGNVAASEQWPWRRGGDDAVGNAADLCASARQVLVRGANGRLNARVLHVPQPLRTARIESLGESLAKDLTRLLDGSPGVRVVHHLEARSAKEESLLLLLGMSRLGDGRVFAPQADLTLELRLAERDGAGRTFDQTPVDVVAALNWATQPAEELRISGTAGERASMAASLYAELETRMAGRGVVSAEQGEMSLRRKQAIAELKKADVWDGHNLHDLDVPRLRQLSEIAATAAKLDPTYEEAAFQAARMEFLYQIRSGDGTDASSALRQVLMYLKRGDAQAKHKATLLSLVSQRADYWDSVMFPPLAANGKPPQYKCNYWEAGDSARREPVLALRDVLDCALSEPAVDSPYLDCVWLIPLTYYGMLDSGIDPQESREWRNHAGLRARDRLIALLRSKDFPKRPNYRQDEYTVWRNLCRYQSLLMQWAKAEQGSQEASRLLDDFMRQVQPPSIARTDSAWDYFLYQEAKALDDAGLWERFRQWSGRSTKLAAAQTRPPMRPIEVKWYKVNVFPVVQESTAKVEDHASYRLRDEPEAELSWEPVARIDTKLYVLFQDRRQEHEGIAAPRLLGYIDIKHLPAGTDARDVQRVIIPVADYRRPGRQIEIACFAANGKQIMFGTAGHGLLCYEPSQDRWEQLGGAQGLPMMNVSSICCVGSDTFLCSGEQRSPDPTHRGKDPFEQVLYTINMESRKVRLVQRTLGRQFGPASVRVVNVWGGDQTWNALTANQLIQGISSEVPRTGPWLPGHAPWAHVAKEANPNGEILAAVRVSGGVLVQSGRGLVLLDANGKLVRVIRGGRGSAVMHVRGPDGCPDNIGATVLNARPLEEYDRLLGGQGNWAVFSAGRQKILLYQVDSKKWYGPVLCSGEIGDATRCLVNEDLLFLRGRIVKLSDVVSAARQAGSIYTDEQYHAAQLSALASRTGRDGAYCAFLMGELETARERLKALLKESPDDTELLMVTGVLHDRPYLNQPSQAIVYYEKLSNIGGNPSARLRGLRLCYFFFVREGRYREAAEVQQELIREFYSQMSLAEQKYYLPHMAKIAAAMRGASGADAVMKQPASAASNE